MSLYQEVLVATLPLSPFPAFYGSISCSKTWKEKISIQKFQINQQSQLFVKVSHQINLKACEFVIHELINCLFLNFRNHPSTIKRRFFSVLIMSFISPLFLYLCTAEHILNKVSKIIVFFVIKRLFCQSSVVPGKFSLIMKETKIILVWDIIVLLIRFFTIFFCNFRLKSLYEKLISKQFWKYFEKY